LRIVRKCTGFPCSALTIVARATFEVRASSAWLSARASRTVRSLSIGRGALALSTNPALRVEPVPDTIVRQLLVTH